MCKSNISLTCYIYGGISWGILSKMENCTAYSGVTGGGAGGQGAPPEASDREISADLSGKERQGKKGKWRRKEGKSKKEIREGGKLKMEEGKVTKWEMRRGLFFFFLSFHFSKPLKFVLGLSKYNWNFLH